MECIRKYVETRFTKSFQIMNLDFLNDLLRLKKQTKNYFECRFHFIGSILGSFSRMYSTKVFIAWAILLESLEEVSNLKQEEIENFY